MTIQDLLAAGFVQSAHAQVREQKFTKVFKNDADEWMYTVELTHVQFTKTVEMWVPSVNMVLGGRPLTLSVYFDDQNDTLPTLLALVETYYKALLATAPVAQTVVH